MKVKLKRYMVPGVQQAISGVMGLNDKLPIKFTYAMAKNLKIFSDEIEAMGHAEKKTIGEFEKERLELCNANTKKDSNGKPVMNGRSFEIENQDIFSAGLEKLKEKHSGALEAQRKFAEEEIEIDIHSVREIDLPDLPARLVAGIMPLVDEVADKGAA